MEFDGEIIKFNIYDSMKYPDEDNTVYSVDIIDELVQETFEIDRADKLEVALTMPIEEDHNELALSSDLQ